MESTILTPYCRMVNYITVVLLLIIFYNSEYRLIYIYIYNDEGCMRAEPNITPHQRSLRLCKLRGNVNE